VVGASLVLLQGFFALIAAAVISWVLPLKEGDAAQDSCLSKSAAGDPVALAVVDFRAASRGQ
jgi:hypothetical protein